MHQINNLVNLVKISPNSLTMLNTKNIEFQFIEVWFTDQNSKQLEIEHNVNIIPVLRQILSMRYFK